MHAMNCSLRWQPAVYYVQPIFDLIPKQRRYDTSKKHHLKTHDFDALSFKSIQPKNWDTSTLRTKNFN